MFSMACNNLHCTATRYRWSVHFALTKYGIPFRMHSIVLHKLLPEKPLLLRNELCYIALSN